MILARGHVASALCRDVILYCSPAFSWFVRNIVGLLDLGNFVNQRCCDDWRPLMCSLTVTRQHQRHPRRWGYCSPVASALLHCWQSAACFAAWAMVWQQTSALRHPSRPRAAAVTARLATLLADAGCTAVYLDTEQPEDALREVLWLLSCCDVRKTSSPPQRGCILMSNAAVRLVSCAVALAAGLASSTWRRQRQAKSYRRDMALNATAASVQLYCRWACVDDIISAPGLMG